MKLPPIALSLPGQSLVEAIYVALRDAIIRGELPEGYRLREIALSRHFDVSTTPVRSALARLDFEGLVEIAPRRGAIVASLEDHELQELYEVREILECHAVRVAAASHSERSLAAVENLLQECEEAAQQADQMQFNALDIEFHAALTELGGNVELRRIAQRTHRRIQAVRVRNAVALPERPRLSQREHHLILQALRAGDADGAEANLRAHIRSVHQEVRAAVGSPQRDGAAPL